MNKAHILKRGFTIVELMMVIGIMAVLATIVTTATTGAIRQARAHKTEAIISMIQVGLNTYYAQKGAWPGTFGSKVENGLNGNVNNDPDSYKLTDSEVDNVVGELVRESVKGGNPLLDVTGLFVCRAGSVNDKTVGMDFMDAVRGTKRHPDKILKVADMCFGYPDKETGRFRRLKIVYSIPSDSITVSK